MELRKYVCNGIQSCPRCDHVSFPSLALLWRAGALCRVQMLWHWILSKQSRAAENPGLRCRDNQACWKVAHSQMCHSPLTLGFFLVYSNQGKQTWSSSLRGIWQHPRRSNEVSGSRYSNEMWTGPYINTRTLAIPQEGSFIDLPRLFCSKLIKGHTA